MREKILCIAPYIRYALLGVIVITCVLLLFKKFGSAYDVFEKGDLAANCKEVSGCKKIWATSAYEADRANSIAKVVLVRDKKIKNPEFRNDIVKALDSLWEKRAGFLSPQWEGKHVEVRYE